MLETDENSFLTMDRLYTEPEGKTRWVLARIPFEPMDNLPDGSKPLPRSIRLASDEIRIYRMPDKFKVNPVRPERRLCIITAGRLEITDSYETVRVFETGAMFIASDDIGPAHSGYAASGPVITTNITLAPELDLDRWLVEPDQAATIRHSN